MTRITLFIGAIIILSSAVAQATPSQPTKDASGETQCPAHYAVAKSTTIDPTTGAIRVRTICVLVSK